MAELLLLKEVSKEYGPEVRLGPFSVSVCPGETLGLQGPNGAGKSTLLKLMGGILRPDKGVRLIKQGLTVGYVPQDVSLYPQLSGRDNLNFFAETGRVPRKLRREKREELLERLELLDKADKRVETYSGGMKRRLNLAAALIVEPDLLLLDEPAVGADQRSALLIEQELLSSQKRGCALVLISHQKEETERLCNRILTLQAGRILFETPGKGSRP